MTADTKEAQNCYSSCQHNLLVWIKKKKKTTSYVQLMSIKSTSTHLLYVPAMFSLEWYWTVSWSDTVQGVSVPATFSCQKGYNVSQTLSSWLHRCGTVTKRWSSNIDVWWLVNVPFAPKMKLAFKGKCCCQFKLASYGSHFMILNDCIICLHCTKLEKHDTLLKRNNVLCFLVFIAPFLPQASYTATAIFFDTWNDCNACKF